MVDSGKGWSEEIYGIYFNYGSFGRTQNRAQRGKNFAKCCALLASLNALELKEAISEATLMQRVILNKQMEKINGKFSNQ